MPSDSRPQGESTRAVHSGSPTDPSGAVATPIFQSATFAFPTTDGLIEVASGRRAGNFYTRYSSPNQRAVEEKLAALEETESALVFGSGMAAISTALLAHLRPGDRLAAFRDLYGGTLNFIRTVLAPFGVGVDWLDIGDEPGLKQALARRPKIVYLETPTNPMLRVIDLETVARRASEAGALTFVDNTFATPINMKPIRLGASLSIHSATKYLGGHSDITGGAVAGPRSVVGPIDPFRKVLGGILSPHEAWLLERSLKTLPLRVERHNRNGQRIAEFLSGHRAVAGVHYPGLPSHPGHAIAARQMRGFGGMLSFELRGGLDAAKRFADRLRLVKLAPSLGGVDSLVSHPIFTSHAALSPEERRRTGIGDGMVRLSLGIEDAEDLIADLTQALET